MPTTYPPAAPSVTSDGVLTINRFLNSPTLIERRLRSLAENRFITDVLLTGRARSSGGAVQFEQGESIFADRNPEAIEPGAKYPTTTLGQGTSLVASVRKWGIDAIVTDEAVRRLLRNPVDRALTKLTNGVVRQVDTVALTAIAAAVTQSITVATAWTTSTRILRDILTGVATIRGLNQGFEPDTLVVDDMLYAIVMSDATIQGGLRREDPRNPIYTGEFPVIAGVRILPSPNLPNAGQPVLLDSTQLGSTVDEVPLSAGSIREENGPTVVEGWVLRAKRVTVPIVQEPAAAIKFVGV